MGKDKIFNRRTFLKALGLGGATAAAPAVVSCVTGDKQASTQEPPVGKMTYRKNLKGEQVSILGYGMMRLPTVGDQGSAREEKDAEIDQEMVNKQIDYAIEHGVNYFDTSPAYCKGLSERALGIALARHKRSEFYVATKLSNFAPETWSYEASVEMFNNSLKELQVDYIDYMLLHGIGMGDDGMKCLDERYLNNGVLDFLLEQREKGKIRYLGFSYHGDIQAYDYLLENHDKYKWDFVQIELNYLDWKHANEINPRNTNAEYLYGELVKRNIPAVIMEPLLGGRLSKLPDALARKLLERDPEHSVASWAFRYAGTWPNVLTVLSGMTYMEHLQDNLRTYCPHKPLSDDELGMLERIAQEYASFRLIPCTGCQYCMPCPYGIDIPSTFKHYNTCLNEGKLISGDFTLETSEEKRAFRKARREFLIGYDRSVPRLRQASHCIGCNQCLAHCPQGINIPEEMRKIDGYTERIKMM